MAEVVEHATGLYRSLIESTKKCMENLDGEKLRLTYLISRNVNPARNILDTTSVILANKLRCGEITTKDHTKYTIALMEEHNKTLDLLLDLRLKTNPKFDIELEKLEIPERRDEYSSI